MTGILAIVLAFFAGAFAQGGAIEVAPAPAPVVKVAPSPKADPLPAPTIIDDEPNFDTEGDGPAPCEGDMIMAEDGSCVPPSFYEDEDMANYVPDRTFGYGPCEFEDSAGPCYWDASERGNGQGQDFFVSADGTVTYWND